MVLAVTVLAISVVSLVAVNVYVLHLAITKLSKPQPIQILQPTYERTGTAELPDNVTVLPQENHDGRLPTDYNQWYMEQAELRALNPLSPYIDDDWEQVTVDREASIKW